MMVYLGQAMYVNSVVPIPDLAGSSLLHHLILT